MGNNENYNLKYARCFNTKYNLVGHLFQGRYRSELIEEDSYNLVISRYIHLNPVRAAMVEFPVDYKWSSYKVYMSKNKANLISEEKILSYFKNKSRNLYKKYVESKVINTKIEKQIEDKMEVE